MEEKKNVMVLAEGKTYDLDCIKTGLNNNVMIVGATGAGKTRGVVIPNLLEATGSYIVSDPKGNLYRKYGDYLRERGYDVMCLDFVHPGKSVHYNFFSYIRSEQDIIKISHILTQDIKTGKHQVGDPFWDQSSSMLLTALIALIMERGKAEQKNVSSIMNLLRMGVRDEESASYNSKLKTLFIDHGIRHRNSWATRQFENVNVAPNRTFNSTLVSLTAKLRYYDSEEMAYLMSGESVDIRGIGTKKTALFVVVSDTDRSMDTLVNMFFTQAMNELCSYADDLCEDSHLPVPVRFIMDDFATNCRIEDFPRMIASIRSRWISTMLILQSEAQLANGYGHDGTTIMGNCDTYLYMGGNDVETAKAVSERLDVPLKKVLNMPVGKNWIFRRGEEPSYNDTIDLNKYLKDKDRHHTHARDRSAA